MKYFRVFLVVIISCAVIWNPVNAEKNKKKETEIQKNDLKLIPVPVPQLKQLEDLVGDQLKEERKMMELITGSKTLSTKLRAKGYGDLAHLYHAYGLAKPAEACYRNAITLDSKSFVWKYCLGYLLQEDGRFEEALEIYKQSCETEEFPNMIYLSQFRMGECLRSMNKLSDARDAFMVSFALNSGEPAILARLGLIALENKQYDSAVKYLEQALKQVPDANRLHYSLGMAYRGLRNRDKSKYHLAMAGSVGIRPSDPLQTKLKTLVEGYITHLLEGKKAYAVEHYDAAAESFKKAIEADPNKPHAHINLGSTYVKLKQFDKALEHFKKAVELAPENTTAHFNLGSIYRFSGDFEKAKDHLLIVLRKDGSDALAHYYLGNVLERLNYVAEAYLHYKETIRLKPEMSECWVDLANLVSTLKQHEDAFNIIKEGFERLPNDITICAAYSNYLSTTPLIEKRNGDLALSLAEKVFEKEKTFDSARLIAMAYAEKGNCTEAVEWMKQSIEMAEKSNAGKQVLETLARNLRHFKESDPCRIPRM